MDSLWTLTEPAAAAALARDIAPQWFHGRESTPRTEEALLEILHHAVYDAEVSLPCLQAFLMAWEEEPYGTPSRLSSEDARYRRYLEVLRMVYNADSKISLAVRPDARTLELSNSAVMMVLQDIQAKRCPHGRACTRMNPVHRRLLHERNRNERNRSPRRGGKRTFKGTSKRTYKRGKGTSYKRNR